MFLQKFLKVSELLIYSKVNSPKKSFIFLEKNSSHEHKKRRHSQHVCKWTFQYALTILDIKIRFFCLLTLMIHLVFNQTFLSHFDQQIFSDYGNHVIYYTRINWDWVGVNCETLCFRVFFLGFNWYKSMLNDDMNLEVWSSSLVKITHKAT